MLDVAKPSFSPKRVHTPNAYFSKNVWSFLIILYTNKPVFGKQLGYLNLNIGYLNDKYACLQI